MNKKVLSKVLVLLSFSVILFSCKLNSEDENHTYKIESGLVSNSIAYTAKDMGDSYGANLTFSKIKTIRDYLYENTSSSEYNGVQTGITRDEVYNFLISHGTSKSTADGQLAFLDSNGNHIVFFYYASSDDKKAWVYAEKE